MKLKNLLMNRYEESHIINSKSNGKRTHSISIRPITILLTLVLGIMGVVVGGKTQIKGSEVNEDIASDHSSVKESLAKSCEEVEANQADTLYGIGSVSKMYVTTAIMQLVEAGKVKLDEPVTTYLPEFHMVDERYKEITVRMLLDHSSGIMGSTFSNNILYEDNDQVAHDTLIEKLAARRLKAAPGTYSTYCNDGFVLAELVVESVSGENFTEYLNQHIFKPLGMNQSGTPIHLVDDPYQAPTYFNESILYGTEYCNVFGTGGLLSTAEEVCKFGQTFMKDHNKLLSDESLIEMRKPAADRQDFGYVKSGSWDHYGLGWDSVDSYPFNEYGITALVKGGDLITQHGTLMVLPEENISVSILSSGGGSVFNGLLAQELAEIALEEKGIIDRKRVEEKANDKRTSQLERQEKTNGEESIESLPVPEAYLKYEGTYANNSSFYEISFPDQAYLQISEYDTEIPRVQKYNYTDKGTFLSHKGSYIANNGLTSSSGLEFGQTILSLMTEKDGKQYVCVDTVQEYAEVGGTQTSGIFAEKIEATHIKAEDLAAWKKRDGKKYYLTSEKYSSAFWNINPVIELNLSTSEEGYIRSSGRMTSTKIVDANHAEAFVTLSGAMGRDMTDISISKKAGKEQLKLDDVYVSYIEETQIPQLETNLKEIRLEQGEAKWYHIGENMAKKTLNIQASEKMAVYIYNQYDECIYSTYMENVDSHVILSEKGKIVFVGEKGSWVELE